MNILGWNKFSRMFFAASIAAGFWIAAGNESKAQSQTAPAQQAVKQFGPRVNQAGRPGAAGNAAKQKVVFENGDWKITCEEKPVDAKADAKPSCGMLQTAQHPDRKNVALTLVLIKSIQNDKPVTMMRVLAPIGVFLPTGVALEIDGAAVGRVPFTRCLPQVCVAFAEASPPTLEKLKKGGKAKFIIYEAPGLGIGLDLSLKGFTASLAELQKR